jgi:hypothetical protein
VALAVCNDVMKLVRRGTGAFWGDERRPSKMVALSSFSVTLRAVFLEDRIRG